MTIITSFMSDKVVDALVRTSTTRIGLDPAALYGRHCIWCAVKPHISPPVIHDECKWWI